MPVDPSGSFKTHAGYLKAFAYLCGYELFQRDPGVSTRLATRITAEPSYAATATRTGIDRNQLKKSLHGAWGSELLLVLTGEYSPEELRGLGNTWVAVQAYYACFHATQALAVAKGQPRPTSHPKTQNMFVDAWVTSGRDQRPWSLGAQAGGYSGLPAGHTVDESIHPWVTLDSSSAIDVACKALRTTREDAVQEAKGNARVNKRSANRKAWQQEEQARLGTSRKPRKIPVFRLPRLTPTEHASVEGAVAVRGLLHYLYRLRIKAQYEDATMFTEGPETTTESLIVYQHLSQIVRATLLLHELFLVRIAGRPLMELLIDDWLTHHAAVPVNPLAARRGLVLP